MDRKDRKLIRGIIAANIIVAAVAIFLWARYNSYIGILIAIISMWTSFTVVRIMMNKYGVCEYYYGGNDLRDRFIRKLMKW
jgi:hypothetical protein